ncbi:hypothetical protein BO70DRAFT_360793 [Aspergillus heteromorphus CBS 117.55]|uniref:Uncharacterized protein n=1 Tax=Aspergillus heteromorphus CBS 117.55 TaxID=1448321 RepID=A0A317WIU1_9EURO|nr:uncharacterized protein BO70DRAFT_360793 [Aspergillus heteromorphus CBS 117.55]PWY85975.1 hypothetical protein BO70DRAFT_360793 [Aspergillus heteromorphus CBS 117.55]
MYPTSLFPFFLILISFSFSLSLFIFFFLSIYFSFKVAFTVPILFDVIFLLYPPPSPPTTIYLLLNPQSEIAFIRSGWATICTI